VSFSPADSRLFGPLFGDEELSALFGDEAYLRYLLRVEIALARAQGRLGVIPASAAGEIAGLAMAGRREAEEEVPGPPLTTPPEPRPATAQGGVPEHAGALQLDWPRLREATSRDGFPIIELLGQLRERLSPAAAGYLHWGATTQDIIDTAMVLQVRDSLAVLEPRLSRLISNLAGLAERHRSTLMAGRTHSQQALPITLGLKAAGWLAPLLRHRRRLAELEPRLMAVQFGGAAGTLASLGERGLQVRDALAEELELAVPPLPWHTQRDAPAEFASWLSLLTGSLAKMAQDVILLAQSEVAELRESGDESRGGSSTMPQKSNPVQSELIVAAARANAALLSSMHHALIQEHERATHGWQLEWQTLPAMLANAGSALAKATWLSENLAVDETQMLRNLRADGGLMMAERVSFALAERMDRAEAKALVARAARQARREGRELMEVVRDLSPLQLDWAALADESGYLGSSQAMIDAVLVLAKQEPLAEARVAEPHLGETQAAQKHLGETQADETNDSDGERSQEQER
jgi:3-carboxy-cis,cis-muconate cycloisomerase